MTKRFVTIERALPLILVICGAVGFIASFMLSLDKLALLENPAFKPICSINPIFNCVTVADTHQAAIFGPPNMFIGIGAFAVVMTVGVALFAGSSMKKWFWRLFNLGLLAGIIFIHWLMIQSIYVIGALCLYCMMVWAIMGPLFWYTTLYNLKTGAISVQPKLKRVADYILKYHDVILASWYFLIILAIVQHFWSYFRTLL